jgi:hypothetical protein
LKKLSKKKLKKHFLNKTLIAFKKAFIYYFLVSIVWNELTLFLANFSSNEFLFQNKFINNSNDFIVLAKTSNFELIIMKNESKMKIKYDLK